MLRAAREEFASLFSRAAERLLQEPADPGAIDGSQELSAFADTLLDLQTDVADPLTTLLEFVGRLPSACQAALEPSLNGVRNLDRRLEWLLSGTDAEQLRHLHPVDDCDRIRHAVSRAFRVESRILETLAINRIAQSTELLLLLRSTKRAEAEPVKRFQDTYGLLSNFFEWGSETTRGHQAVERMRAIHGRYFIPNEGMKYILLETVFTWLDGAEVIGHRRLSRLECEGCFHSMIKLGHAIGVQGLSHDFDSMYGWYAEFNRQHAMFHPQKKLTYDSFLARSLQDAEPTLARAVELACRVAMPTEYREAIGGVPPSRAEADAVRGVMFTLGWAAESFPSGVYIRSLQNNPAHHTYTQARDLGVAGRSTHMPRRADVGPNAGFPAYTPPVISAETEPLEDLPLIARDEVSRHDGPESLWLVIGGGVYDVTSMVAAHPGGSRVLLEHAGADATEAFEAANHGEMTRILMRNYLVGRVEA